MGLAGPSLGRELRALSSEPHRTGAGVAPPEISVTESRTDCDLTQQMVGGIHQASSPSRKSMSADMFLDLPTMLVPTCTSDLHNSDNYYLTPDSTVKP